MGARHADERAAAWARSLSELKRARGILLVEDDRVLRADPAAFSASDLLDRDVRPPRGAVRVDEESLSRLRAAISTVSHARDVEELIGRGRPELRRWRGTDVRLLVGEASGFAERLAWALDAAARRRRLSRPPGLIIVDADDRLGVGDVAGFPDLRVGAAIVDADRRVADRLCDIGGAELARRWAATAAGRWWPSPEVVQLIEGFVRRAEHSAAQAEVAAIIAEVESCLGDRLLPVPVRRLRAVRTRGELVAALGVLFDTAAHLRQAQVVGFGVAPEAADGLCLATEWVDALHSWVGEDREQCLAVLRSTPDARFTIPPEASSRSVESVRILLLDADRKWVRGVGESVGGWLEADLLLDRWLAGHPHGLAEQVAARWPVPEPTGGWVVSSLRRYLRVLDSAGDAGSQGGAWLRQRWVAQLASSDLAPGALSLLLAVGRAEAGAESAVAALAAQLLPGSQDLKSELQAWGNPTTVEVDTSELSAAVGLDEALLREYLHYRRLSGDAERLPKSLAALADAGHEQRIAAIEALIAAGGLSEEREATLRGELARLTDSVVRAGRRDAMRRRVRNQIERATSSYRLASLRKLLEDYARRRLPDLPAKVPMALLAEVVGLCGAYRVDRDALRRFLIDPTAAAVAGWEENTRWVERQRNCFDVGRWLAGFSEVRTVAGVAVRYRVEREPVMAIHMGTWFDTCLSVHDGMNRYSALINAVEANRHVVYGLDPSGNVIARKLIAVSSTGDLLGYRTYAHSDTAEHRLVLNDICKTFGRQCGLGLSDQGSPESLLGADWYDDGTEAWMSPAMPQGPDAASRDVLTDEQVAHIASTSYDHDLICGLLLDRRITPEAIAAHILEHEHCEGDCIQAAMLIDPDGVSRAFERAPRPRLRLHLKLQQGRFFVDVPASRDAVSAAARAGLPLYDGLLLLLPVGEALDYLRNVQEYLPSELTIRALRMRGTAPRDLQRAARGAVRRAAALAEQMGYILDASQVASRSLVVAPDAQLRRMLTGESTTVVAAARELAIRGSYASAQAVQEAVERWPSSPQLVAAAAVLGRDVPAGGMADWDNVSVSDAPLIRLAVARGMSTEPLRRPLRSGLAATSATLDGQRLAARLELLANAGDVYVEEFAAEANPQLLNALVRHPHGREPFPAVQRSQAVRQIDTAVGAAQRGDWGPMTDLAGEAPVLLNDARVVNTVIDATRAADPQLYGCASMLTQVPWENSPEDVSELASFVFAEAAARATLGEDLAHAIAVASYNLASRAPFIPLGDSVTTALASALLSPARLRTLTITSGPKGGLHSGSNLAWSLAASYRKDPSVIQYAPGLPVRGIAVLIDSLARTLPATEFAGLGHEILGSLRPADARSVAAMLAEDSCWLRPAARQLAMSWSTSPSATSRPPGRSSRP